MKITKNKTIRNSQFSYYYNKNYIDMSFSWPHTNLIELRANHHSLNKLIFYDYRLL